MAVLQFKPSRLSYLITNPGYEDENGDFHTSTSQWEGDIECGYATAGASNEIKFEDGTVKVYSYTVTLPRDCRDFADGDRVRLIMLNGKEREFSVKGFQRYQLQCKMWI